MAETLFKDKLLQEEILLKGFAKRKLFSEDSLNEFRTATKKVIDNVPFSEKLLKFKSIGRISNKEVINKSTLCIKTHVVPYLKSYFTEDVDFISGVHLIKPPSPLSKLNPHQDSSLVDERKYLSVYAWTPLIDTQKRNGGIFVIPGSHTFGNYQRSLNIYWQFLPFVSTLNKYIVPVEVNAGEVLFFHSAMIHGSYPNYSLKNRIAANVFIKPKKAAYLHFFSTNPKADKVEIYQVTPDFYYNHDILKKPAFPFTLIETQERQDLQLTKDIVVNLCESVKRKTHDKWFNI